MYTIWIVTFIYLTEIRIYSALCFYTLIGPTEVRRAPDRSSDLARSRLASGALAGPPEVDISFLNKTANLPAPVIVPAKLIIKPSNGRTRSCKPFSRTASPNSFGT
jgi:hypothetical protein